MNKYLFIYRGPQLTSAEQRWADREEDITTRTSIMPLLSPLL